MKGFLRRLLRSGRSRAEAGRLAEEAVARFLESKGFKVLGRNLRYRDGEIDIVAEEEGTIVFVEVKARRSEEFGVGAEAVTPEKRRRIVRAALRFLAGVGEEVPCRFDVIEVRLDNRGRPVGFRHIRGAFGEE